jgi:hypothetical protein
MAAVYLAVIPRPPVLGGLNGPKAQNQRNEAQDAPRVRGQGVRVQRLSFVDGLCAHTLNFSVLAGPGWLVFVF